MSTKKGGRTKRPRLDWPPIVERAAEIVRSYSTSVTLRQLFYRLVSDGTLPNTRGAYSTLSDRTAEARRQGTFPDLLDRGRSIHRYRTFPNPQVAGRYVARIYRRDRTEGQEFNVYLGVEKNGMVEQLDAWFGDLGLPILALAGYSSQTYVDEVADDIASDNRRAVLLYGGDFDSSGEDIDRDFVTRTRSFSKVIRVGLTQQQVIDFDLPPQPGQAKDSRASSFIARHGELLQVELDALDPDDLQELYKEALDEFWEPSAYEVALEREERDREVLRSIRMAEEGDE
ncbi:MAG: hypothetical protein ACR2NT_05590 [Acidimicrobiia bacterium]